MRQGTILIVEDEAEVAELLRFHLERAGFATLTAHDGLGACRLIGARGPDLVLLDVGLPDLAGWEICRMVRSHPDPAIASTPVLFLTALATADDVARGLELGADDYVTKPFSIREVLLRVRTLVERRRETRTLASRLAHSERERQREADLQGLLFHELKNKLAALGGLSRRLASGETPRTGAEGCARMIESTSRYLEALAEQVLALRRVEAGSLTLLPEATDLGDLARAAAALHAGTARRRDLAVRVASGEGGGAAWANPLAARVCVSNLIENAVRYAFPSTPVDVRVGRRGDRAFVEVEDRGPGIAAAEQAAVFGRFYRGASSAGTEGTGLGLYLVRILAEAMGGEVTLESEPGRGTRVRLLLPAERSSRPAAVPVEAAGPPAHPRPTST